jgi:hypothetical protein
MFSLFPLHLPFVKMPLLSDATTYWSYSFLMSELYS